MLPSPLVTVELAFGYMLEHPCIPRYQLAQASGDNATGADDQQERPRAQALGILRDCTPNVSLLATRGEMMRQSVLYGDV